MSGEELSAQPIELLVVGEAHAGARLDWFLAQQFPNYSRVLLRKVINAAGVQGRRQAGQGGPSPARAASGSTIALPELAREGPQPENIPLEILYEDDAIWRSSTSRRAWSCIRPRDIGPAR